MEKAADSTGLIFRQDYFADDQAWSALVSFLPAMLSPMADF